MRQWPAVPVASADVSDQVPDNDFEPDEAAAIQSDGRLIVARTVPLSAEAQVAGGLPERMRRIADAPIVVSKASSWALRTATEY